jgi:hypothetical protein
VVIDGNIVEIQLGPAPAVNTLFVTPKQRPDDDE